MAITEEELDAKRQRVEKLREQVAAERQKRAARESDLVNEVAAAQLDAEATHLEATLEAERRNNKVAEVKAGAASVLDAVRADQANAKERASAQAKSFDELDKLREDNKATDATTEKG